MAGVGVRPPRIGGGCDLTRGKLGAAGHLPDFESHQRAVETLVNALQVHRNWYLDLANERDVRDERHVPVTELKTLRDLVRRLDPSRLVTASFGGHDLSEQDVREALLIAGLDFLSPHRPRAAGSPNQTEARTRDCLTMMKELGRDAPVHYQEPFRRGYGGWDPRGGRFFGRSTWGAKWRSGWLVFAQRTTAWRPRESSAAFIRPPGKTPV